ncbi:MAG TPA: glycosyltransferase [Longimicrobium sp.]
MSTAAAGPPPLVSPSPSPTPGAVAAPELTVVVATHDNLEMLRRCLDGWRRHGGDAVEVIVVEDGCTDGTADFLAREAETEWGRRSLRWLHAGDVHELVCTNLGLAAARAPLVLSWHDDMFLRAGWLVPELVATFRAHPELGVLALSRGLNLGPDGGLPGSWDESMEWRRVQSTIGPAPLNWLRLHEVDGVMRPWVVRRACVARVGALDEAYRPTEWDEVDLCFRVRAAGWRVATHGYERDGAYVHALSTTYGRTPSERRQAAALRNARIFYARWGRAVEEGHGRARRHWRRVATPAGWAATLRAIPWNAARRVLGK